MFSLQQSLRRLGVDGSGGIRDAFPVRPTGLRELLRAANLPDPSTADLEPDDPHTFESFEVEDPQGLAYVGGERWVLSSQFTVRGVRIVAADPFGPTRVVHGASRHIDDLLDEAGLPDEFDHIGDLGHAGGVVYAPIRHESHEPPHQIFGLSPDLRVVGRARLADTSGESGCAVHPWNGLLYVPSVTVPGRLEAYDVAGFRDRLARPADWGRPILMPRRPLADLLLRTPGGEPEAQGVQGFAFSVNGRAYVTRSLGDGPWNNFVYAYSVLTGRRFGPGREWDFPGRGDEIEGIVVHPSGVLYLVVADNDNETFDNDDFDLYTFRFRSLPPDQV
ncbi:hypothetical protein SAMN05421812_107143 [Asanoa hainanensis]|uniref:Uncharacterized protein n=1 Tax=Asanoa hainanensis TaxID=560556 RepID=A0A239N1I2_9ACTN|nr:hypothetical protein [Asanoa hainanensis]SNT48816.1 hypothetical protein SAMN05421812_107143 [Asanoa hainanensis]